MGCDAGEGISLVVAGLEDLVAFCEGLVGLEAGLVDSGGLARRVGQGGGPEACALVLGSFEAELDVSESFVAQGGPGAVLECRVEWGR